MRKHRVLGAVILAVLVIAPAARADIVMEAGDAGQLPGTAQNLFGTGQILDAIVGRVNTSTDADLYLIHIFDPAKFSATTVGVVAGALNDTQLFLFNFAGRGVYANNDTAVPASVRSTLPAGSLLSPKDPGYYYLGISAFDRDPVSSPMNNLIFPSVPFNGVFGPTGPGGAGVLSDWVGAGNIGNYRINLTGANLVPEPSTLLLAGMGTLGLLGVTLRRRRRV